MKAIELTLLAIVLLLGGCAKDEILSFDLDTKVNIYKDRGNAQRDSTTYSFAVQLPETVQDTVFIPVRILGNISDRDRKVNYEVLPKSEVSEDNYSLLPAIIPAGEFHGMIPIIVKRTAALTTQEMRLWIRITPSEDLDVGASDQLEYLLKINDYLTKPTTWVDTYFGPFSQVKYGLIIRETGYTEFGDSTLWFYILQTAKNALFEYEERTGSPMVDEFDQVIVFPL